MLADHWRGSAADENLPIVLGITLFASFFTGTLEWSTRVQCHECLTLYRDQFADPCAADEVAGNDREAWFAPERRAA